MSEIGKKIGLIGAGNMAEAIIGAIIRSNISDPTMIHISDIDKNRLVGMKKSYRVMATEDNFEVFTTCDVVILAVKPQQMNQVLSEIACQETYTIPGRKLIISIAAGIPIRKIEDLLYPPLNEKSRNNLPIIRVMPNTPSLVLRGMSGMSSNRFATSEDIRITRTILEAMGKVIEFNEECIDTVTALSGSGPAYVFYLVESMIAAAAALGLDPGDATVLTLQTIKGAINLLEDRNESPEHLRQKVTSPGGTTEAAFKVLEKNNVKQTIIEAIIAAANRSKELSA